MHVPLFVDVYLMCTEVFLAPVSLGWLPSIVFSCTNTQAQVRRGVWGAGEEKGRVMYAALFISSHPCQCFVPISLWHFRGWGGKKATKQCNGEKDLQHSTIELREAWRMKQMPRLPLTIPCLATYLQPDMQITCTGDHNSIPGLLYYMSSS